MHTHTHSICTWYWLEWEYFLNTYANTLHPSAMPSSPPPTRPSLRPAVPYSLSRPARKASRPDATKPLCVARRRVSWALGDHLNPFRNAESRVFRCSSCVVFSLLPSLISVSICVFMYNEPCCYLVLIKFRPRSAKLLTSLIVSQSYRVISDSLSIFCHCPFAAIK